MTLCQATTAALLATLLLTGCERSGGLSDLQDYELATRADECVRVKDPSPGLGLACENVRKECQRRENNSIEDICPLLK